MRLALVLALVLLSGCEIYLGHDGDSGDDTVCTGGGNDGAAEPPYVPYQIINPDTLACEDFGGWGGGCSDPCLPCTGAADQAPLPSWGLCDSYCRVLNEGDCMSEPGCRATYDSNCYIGGDDGACTAEVAFTGCFPTDMNGPIQGGNCAGLDAWTCSQHDDCIALHDFTGVADYFVACRPEMPTCAMHTTEAECVGAGEPCIPAYDGTDCTCDPQGVCECAVWTYRECVENR